MFVYETYFWSPDYLATHLKCKKKKLKHYWQNNTYVSNILVSQWLTTVTSPHHWSPFIHWTVTMHPNVSHCTKNKTTALGIGKVTASIYTTPRKVLGSASQWPIFLWSNKVHDLSVAAWQITLKFHSLKPHRVGKGWGRACRTLSSQISRAYAQAKLSYLLKTQFKRS